MDMFYRRAPVFAGSKRVNCFGSVRLGGVGGAAGDNTSVAAQITLRPVEATLPSSHI